MSNFGMVLEIQKDRAIILTGSKKFIAVKKRDDMVIGKMISFDESEVFRPESKVYRYAPSSRRIENFSRISGIKGFSRINNIKNFSRVSGSKESSHESNIVDFSRVSNRKKSETKNFSRISGIKNFSRIASVAAGFMLIFLFSRNFMLNNGSNSEYAYVSVDINPSIGIVINSEFKVNDAFAINPDAAKVLEGLELKEKDLKSAMALVINKAELLGYITDDEENFVFVSMALNDKNKEYENAEVKRDEKLNELKENLIQGMQESDNIEIIQKTVIVNLEEREEALENDMSMGRYYLYLKAVEKGIDITIDEVKTLEISDLIERIEGNPEPSPTPMPSIKPTPLESPDLSSTPLPEPSTTEITPSNSPVTIKSPAVTPGLSKKEISTLSKSVVSVVAFDENKGIVSQGSGFCIGTGLFVTNHHIIKDGVVVRITSEDGKTYNVEGIVKYDKGRDLVVLKTTANTEMKPLKIGSKSYLSKGGRVVAIGNPDGSKNTTSEGIVSGLRVDAIEITAPISKGSSGGPLLDMKGNVVGIASYGLSKGNLNYAIPADYIAGWVNELARQSFNDISVIRKTLVFDDDFELNLVVYNIVSALENEDISMYFKNMTDELYTEETRNNLEVLFAGFDLVYNIESLKFTSKNEEQAKISYVYTITKANGQEFKNCRITGECSIVKVGGVWKIRASTEKMEYIE